MLRLLLAVALLGQVAVPTPERPCRLKIGYGIGCIGGSGIGPTNAADAFIAYGLNRERLSADATTAYLQRFNCFRVIESTKPIGLKRIGHLDVDEPDGPVRVDFLITPDKRVFWIAQPYLTNSCPVDTTPPEVGRGVPLERSSR